MTDALLSLRAVTVRFGGLLAVDRATFDVAPGTVTGLVGPNGAGKTTCFNAICGLQPVHRGRILLDGVEVTDESAHRRARRGIGRTFQRLETFRTLSARENVMVAAEMARSHRGDGRGDHRPPAQVAEEILELIGLVDVADRVVEDLPTGTQRLVELGRSLAAAPRLLLLDEPSSGLNDSETALMGVLLRQLADDGLSVLLVEHDMPFVMGLCDTVHVLEFGTVISSGEPAVVQADPLVRDAYLGHRDTSAPSPLAARTAPTGSPGGSGPLLEVKEVTAGYGKIDVLHGVSIEVGGGQVLAVLGTNGSGKSTLLRVVTGLVQPRQGRVDLEGRDVTRVGADVRARSGMCCIPEGRGVFPRLSVSENLWVSTHAGVSRSDVEDAAFERFPVLAKRRDQLAGSLSGGEQQMLAMSRALSTDPRVLLIDELSMGLAPLVVARLYEEVARLAETGEIAIVVVEQFAHEVLSVADHAVVLAHGRVVLEGRPTDVASGMDAAYLGLAPPSGSSAPALGGSMRTRQGHDAQS